MASERRFCVNCGKPAGPQDKFCAYCGHTLAVPAVSVPPAAITDRLIPFHFRRNRTKIPLCLILP